MKQFVYQPAHLDLQIWPPGELALDFPITFNHNEADVFVVPGTLTLFTDTDSLYKLPYYKGNEDRHVFLYIGDQFDVVYNRPSLFLRSNLKTWMLQHDPNSISIPWPVDDFTHTDFSGVHGHIHDVSFHGWVPFGQGSVVRGARGLAVNSCRREGLDCDIITYSNFYGHVPKTQQEARRRVYAESLKHCRLALCPESIPGDIPYRFYEALSAGRIPVLVGSDYVLPFPEVIPWPDICVRISRENANATGPMLGSWLNRTSKENLDSMGVLARLYWVRYLDPGGWKAAFTRAVQHKLKSV